MKYEHIEEDTNGKIPQANNSVRKTTLLIILFFMTLTTLPLYLSNNNNDDDCSPLSLTTTTTTQETCDIFNGTWVPHHGDPYYTNETCNLIIDEQNCMKFGRPDSDYLRWRWSPDACELPRFDALRFLEIVRGKSLAFLGDSVGKNQMYSLLCLLANAVGDPEDVSEKYSNNTTYFKRYVFGSHNFTAGTLWAPFLVRAEESDPGGYSANSRMSLYLDEPSPGWAPDAAGFDYVVVSAGQWFFRPAMLYRNRTLVGCSNCGGEGDAGLERFTAFEAYGRAFGTALRGLAGLEGYRGVTILRTFSPSHFEGGAWNDGGRCVRTEPLGREARAEWYVGEMRRVQLEEFEEARAVAERKGLDFRLMDTTRAMFLRPDGHPDFYGRSPRRNMSYADCVHWCLPGPVDLWNEILLYILTDQHP